MKNLIEKFLSRKGQFAGILWNRPVKTRKEFAHLTVTKSVRCVAQVGVNYDNRASVQEARESGALPAENAGLPWGQWEIFPFIVAHKGAQYLRIYPVSGRSPRVVYRVNGSIVSPDTVREMALASEFPSAPREPFTCFTVRADSVTAVR